jgi:uncharacterized repeat protein (TIGR03803 family)
LTFRKVIKFQVSLLDENQVMKGNIILLISILFFLSFGATKAQYTVLHNFNNTLGYDPFGNATISGSKLYGMTLAGGKYDSGLVFSMDTNGNNFKDLLDFNGTNGSEPVGSLIISRGKLFGMTDIGGVHDSGLVFSVDTNGANYKDLLDFNGINGQLPKGSLTLSGSKLFGMTSGGGADSAGLIFSIDTDGNNYKDILDFIGTNGLNPYGNVILSDNKLMGMTYLGGKYNQGLIFSIDSNGSNYKDIYDFSIAYGEWPYGSLVLSGSKLFGMTNRGGTHSFYGLIFSIDSTGSNYKVLLDFDLTNGGGARGSLILSGDILYGMTLYGGAYGDGLIFSLDTTGNAYSDLLDFNGIDGELPYGDLTYSGGKFYGMTYGGGIYNNGVIFSLVDSAILTGVEKTNVNLSRVNIFPNPSNGKFTIAFVGTQNFVSGTVEIYNVMGERVLTEIHRSAQDDKVMDLTGQPNGIYFYRVLDENGGVLGSGKLIIQK